MDLNEILDNYLTNLVQENFGGDLDEDEIPDAKAELLSAFMHLFNAHLIDSFSDEDLPEVEAFIKQGQLEKVAELAVSKGVNTADLMQNVMIEFRELYRGEAVQEEPQEEE